MTHERSLDSHRVRCLNARLIIGELDHELREGRIKPEELVELCAEADEILAQDCVVTGSLSRHYALIKPLLHKPPMISPEKGKDQQKGEDQQLKQALREFRFTVADFAAALETVYVKQLVAMIPDSIASANEDDTFKLVGSLLSDLVDQGWTLESLFRWVDLFFQQKRQPHHATFASNLHFMLRQLDGGRQKFRVILRLSGSSKLSEFGTFGGFEFRAVPGFTPTNPTQQKFAKHDNLATFAETLVESVDFNSAAIKGREEFEDCLDLLRFNFEPSPLKIDSRCFVERAGDKRGELPVVDHLVPNPVHHLPVDAFRKFSDKMDDVLGRSSIEQESRERLRAAVRHYRFGRDADSYKDKFLNWWMGLEFLASPSPGEPIGTAVVRHCSDALVQRYLYRLVGDLLQTVKEQNIIWQDDFATVTGTSALHSLESGGLLKILQSPAQAQQLAQQFPENPVAVRRIKRIAEQLQDPIKTAELLAAHHNHLRWQVARLYRIRCCIVHGSPLAFKLPLFAANLEFYLRELIIICLRALQLNSHINSLREVFQRAALVRTRTDKELRATPPASDAVWATVFSAMIIQEST